MVFDYIHFISFIPFVFATLNAALRYSISVHQNKSKITSAKLMMVHQREQRIVDAREKNLTRVLIIPKKRHTQYEIKSPFESMKHIFSTSLIYVNVYVIFLFFFDFFVIWLVKWFCLLWYTNIHKYLLSFRGYFSFYVIFSIFFFTPFVSHLL